LTSALGYSTFISAKKILSESGLFIFKPDKSIQSVESVSEKEKDLPVAMDCTTLTFVDNALNNPASLLAENQDCGVEQRDCYEGTGSAALIAKNEKSLNSAIANQTQGQVEQDYSATLLVENSVSGVEVKADHEGEGSADKPFHVYAHQTEEQAKQGYSASLKASKQYQIIKLYGRAKAGLI
jgi:hypothetical protein